MERKESEGKREGQGSDRRQANQALIAIKEKCRLYVLKVLNKCPAVSHTHRLQVCSARASKVDLCALVFGSVRRKWLDFAHIYLWLQVHISYRHKLKTAHVLTTGTPFRVQYV